MFRVIAIGLLGLSLLCVAACGRSEADKGVSTPTISGPLPKDGVPQPIQVAPAGGGGGEQKAPTNTSAQ